MFLRSTLNIIVGLIITNYLVSFTTSWSCKVDLIPGGGGNTFFPFDERRYSSKKIVFCRAEWYNWPPRFVRQSLFQTFLNRMSWSIDSTKSKISISMIAWTSRGLSVYHFATTLAYGSLAVLPRNFSKIFLYSPILGHSARIHVVSVTRWVWQFLEFNPNAYNW